VSPDGDRPNILVLMTDQHSRHVLGCYGNGVVRTPNIDRLAGQRVRFTDAYCPAPLCVPSRMSFMTSRTPSQNEVWDNRHILGSSIPTWAHALGIAGYETALIGRMHFVGPDQRHGFEQRPIGERSAGPPGMRARDGPLHTQFPLATHGSSRQAVEIAGRGRTLRQWGDEERTRVAVRWLEERAESNDGQSFAAVFGTILPNCPYVAPPGLFDYCFDRVDVPQREDRRPATILREQESQGILDPPLTPERIRVARAAYFALCEHVDSLVGQVLDALDRTGLAESTVVIYASDHGDTAGDHGCWGKSTYYQGSAGVPLIARWPGVVAPGTTSRAVCNLTDHRPVEGRPPAGSTPWPTFLIASSRNRPQTCAVAAPREGGDQRSRAAATETCPEWESLRNETAHRRPCRLPRRSRRSGPRSARRRRLAAVRPRRRNRQEALVAPRRPGGPADARQRANDFEVAVPDERPRARRPGRRAGLVS
jgi:choline-sulfatase